MADFRVFLRARVTLLIWVDFCIIVHSAAVAFKGFVSFCVFVWPHAGVLLRCVDFSLKQLILYEVFFDICIFRLTFYAAFLTVAMQKYREGCTHFSFSPIF